jgi:hypothetical protein
VNSSPLTISELPRFSLQDNTDQSFARLSPLAERCSSDRRLPMLGVACHHSKGTFLKLLDSAVDDLCATGSLQRQAPEQMPVTMEQFLEKL